MTVYRAVASHIADDGRVVLSKHVEYYSAADGDAAAAACLYAHKLHDGGAKLGISGRVVYCPRCGAFAVLRDLGEGRVSDGR